MKWSRHCFLVSSFRNTSRTRFGCSFLASCNRWLSFGSSFAPWRLWLSGNLAKRLARFEIGCLVINLKPAGVFFSLSQEAGPFALDEFHDRLGHRKLIRLATGSIVALFGFYKFQERFVAGMSVRATTSTAQDVDIPGIHNDGVDVVAIFDFAFRHCLFEIVECVCIVRRIMPIVKDEKRTQRTHFLDSTSYLALASRVQNKDFVAFFVKSS